MKSLLTEKQVAKVWRKFKRTGDQDLRQVLVEKYLPSVSRTAQRMQLKLPLHVELGDLTSAGTFGLLRAVDRFDLKRGVKFETYSTPRIRGAILDELRALDWVPRSARKKASRGEAHAIAMVRLTDALENKKQARPEDELVRKDSFEALTRYLNRRERTIMLLYYEKDLTMREIGVVFGVTESRICGLHTQIIERLKSQLEGRWTA